MTYRNGPTSASNARLIAAAPDLYEALAAVMAHVDSGVLVRDISHDHERDWAMRQIHLVRALKMAQDALAKATS